MIIWDFTNEPPDHSAILLIPNPSKLVIGFFTFNDNSLPLGNWQN